jgi:hypothetical protein
MPTITELKFDPKFISLSAERDAKRSPGIHLSTILKDMLLTAGIQRFKSTAPRGVITDEQHLTFESGFLWERMVSEYIASPENQQIEFDRWATKHLAQLTTDAIEQSGGALVRPGECQMDGIYMTPDAANMKLWHLEEWKATSLAPCGPKIFTKRIEWLWQGASYCRFYGMTRCIYRVWHLPRTVVQLAVEWSTNEIESEWAKVLEHHKLMRDEGRA